MARLMLFKGFLLTVAIFGTQSFDCFELVFARCGIRPVDLVLDGRSGSRSDAAEHCGKANFHTQRQLIAMP